VSAHLENQALMQEVYLRLRAIAHRERARFGAGATLNTTALVHELFLELQQAGQRLAPRAFYAYAARAMRNLLIDEARRRGRIKRGGEWQRTDIDALSEHAGAADAGQLLELDEALRQLAQADPRAAEIVEMHYFGGLELAAIAQALGISERTVNRDWRAARAWLQQRLSD
jgi:RNA polymerase sigma factor (TIGR02999 family)